MHPAHQAQRTYTSGYPYKRYARRRAPLHIRQCARLARIAAPHPAATGRGRNAYRTTALEDAEIVDRQVAAEVAAARIDELELHVAA